MPVSPYFQDTEFGSQEASLVEDMVIEAIQVTGRNAYYIPRESATGAIDHLFGEDNLSKFSNAFLIEVYVDRVEGFDGQGELLSKFGLQLNNQMDLVMSIRRFKDATDYQYERPREGDLIYLDLKPGLFEIKYVEDKSDFYQLGKLYTYKLRVELFRYGNETIDTGVEPIDDIEANVGYKLAFTMGTGTGNYQAGELVYQGPAFATATGVAEVASWDHPSKILNVINIAGDFVANTNIVGVLSAASYSLTSYDDLTDQNSGMNANRTIQDEANSTIDFSESNPFSESTP